MAYTLDEFCADCRKAIREDDGPGAREKVRQNLERLLENKAFVAENCGPNAEVGVHTLYHDPETDFYVLAHINAKGRKSPPHDHGTSWAVYGQAVGHTDMTVWRRLDDGKKPGYAEIEPDHTYRLTPGKAGRFDIRDIHQIEFADNARFVRITGTDLATVPTYRYDPEKKAVHVADRVPAGPVVAHAGAGAGAV